MIHETKLSPEEFVELLIEIDALQRLFVTWTSSEELVEEDEESIRLEVLDSMLARKMALRDEALAEFRMIYPELEKFDWAKPEYDA
jgi:hypothetical protein